MGNHPRRACGQLTPLPFTAHRDPPDSGVMLWRSRDYRDSLAHLRRLIGYLPQTLELPPHLTPYRRLRYLAQMLGVLHQGHLSVTLFKGSGNAQPESLIQC
jgi:ABC-type proline/glycine betaine transport system ATPase subunit